jgi:hypothetical protein
MAEVTDDFGNVFRRGALTASPARDWDVLAAGPSRGRLPAARPGTCARPA